MSYIREISVVGLAGKTKALSATLNRDINLFFGLNGCGKTSLLKIIHSVFKNDTSLLVNVHFTSARIVLYSENYKQEFVYTLDKAPKPEDPQIEELPPSSLLRRLGAAENGIRPWNVEPPLPPDAKPMWRVRYLPINRLVQRVVRSEDNSSDEDYYDRVYAEGLSRHWSRFFGGIQSKVRQIQQAGIADILNEIITTEGTRPTASNMDWEIAYAKTRDFLRRQNQYMPIISKEAFQKRFTESPALQKVVDLINKIENDIAIELEPRTKLQELITKLFSGNKTVNFADTSIELKTLDNIPIGLQSLSSGEKQILRILFDSLGAESSTLIIDEPELSLHIDWQRKLISSIMELNPNLQLIAATHSPEVLADLDDSKIFKIPT